METVIDLLYTEKNTLYKEKELIQNEINALSDASDVLYKYKIDDNIISGVLEARNNLHDKLTFIQDKYKNVLNNIKEYQDKCSHDLTYIGHDSHRDFYVCKKCGYQTKI